MRTEIIYTATKFLRFSNVEGIGPLIPELSKYLQGNIRLNLYSVVITIMRYHI